MPLDPDIAKLLKIMEGTTIPDITQIDIREFRKMMEQSPLPKKQEVVKSVENLKFEHHGIHIPLRLYTPENAGNGIIIYFHGGGFVFGNIDSHDGICRLAANRSRTKVLSVDYRLAPENKFPAALDDSLEALKWVQNNSEKLGIDPTRIAVSGDSAGGNLSAGVCLKARDMKIRLPKLQILIYPSAGRSGASHSMTEYGENFFLTEKQMSYFGQAYLNDQTDLLNPYFSIISHPDLSGLPEAIVVTAEYDPLRDEGETYLSRMQKSGVRATGIRAKGMIHGFASFFPVVPAAENLLTMIYSLAGNLL
ncbi:MAG: alpha/beta hydrolase, partial [Candidatus Thermoplasmatota archaeon]|nr:alpha/beta hydrolase [Candidatus Thermoplasmatota archaeon]